MEKRKSRRCGYKLEKDEKLIDGMCVECDSDLPRKPEVSA